MLVDQTINGRYRIVKKIGAGSYGDVYLVNDSSDGGRELVVKVSSSKQASNHTEARMMLELNHPNVVKAFDSFLLGDDICIVMRYFRNGTILSHVLQMRDISPYIEKWCAQLLSAVNYLHRENILHRDVKLENLFLDENFDLILGDLGISRDLNLSLAKTFIGTPQHMSPEMFNNRAYSTKSDMWAVGCCIYHMLEGQFPFQGALPVIMQAVEKVEYRPMAGRDFPVLREMIVKMLVYEPNERIDSYQAALMLQNVFEKYNIALALPIQLEQEQQETSQANALIQAQAMQQISQFQRASHSNVIVKEILDFFIRTCPTETCAYNMVLAYYFMTQNVPLKDICNLVHVDPAVLSVPELDWVANACQSYLDAERFMEALFYEMSGLNNVDLLVRLAKQVVMISMFQYSEE